MSNGEITDEKFQSLSQKAHFALGALFITAPWMLHPHPIAILVGFTLCVAYAAAKEFFFDARYEEEPERGSNFADFIWHVIGAIAAMVVWAVSQHYML